MISAGAVNQNDASVFAVFIFGDRRFMKNIKNSYFV
jgi:hypothetical protein